MAKNPISILQEYMASHKREIPNYVIFEQTVENNTHTFHMRVQCDGRTAEGIGRSKKEAKNNSAINMLKLLKLYPNEIPPNPCRSDNNSSVTGSEENSPSTVINYVGKLQEITAHKSASPVYTLKSVSGPPHNCLFTYTCKYEEWEEEASSKTKKEAKSLAAQKMLERISANQQDTATDFNYHSYLNDMSTLMSNIKECEDNMSSIVKSASKAKQYYPKINKTGKKVVSHKRSYDEYHTFLKSSFSNNERQLALNQLQETLKLCENFSKGIDKFTNPKHILFSILENLKITMREVAYLPGKENIIYGIRLLTNPIISEIGFGINKTVAENMAVYEIAKTLSIMLL